jgi:hypothetical protein
MGLIGTNRTSWDKPDKAFKDGFCGFCGGHDSMAVGRIADEPHSLFQADQRAFS